MKKIKWSVLSLAVVFSVCAAFATRPHFDCTTQQQYYFTGSGYLPVNPNYGCLQGFTNCTYYTNNGGVTYTPCTIGMYNPCPACAVIPAQPKSGPAPSSGNSAVSTH